MTTLIIPALDHGKIRVFSYAGPLTEEMRSKASSALQALLGTDSLNTDFIDIFEVEALGDLSLSDYLRTGYDLMPDGVDAAALRNLNGVVILVMSRASADEDIALTLAPEVTHVTTLGDGAALKVSAPLPSEGAKGILSDPPGKKPMSDARMSGMVAMAALFVMFALVALMVWIGG